ncbi:Histidine--tRNA ligase [Candidatus Hodgkinia cicadicola]|uniref:Histidine--tRNA ligase n=1 Tax=Candidatus Hodgkinia cicadicola TaxID=573658 RepID=A0ABX4MHP9_9HYPH|nr:Histidine--tRNA ligase [Candidatus Hodgkinia cicadicola]PIM95952.1 Histidine--tRNA ligase [Candidatus Hodgkinia cicadicola]
MGIDIIEANLIKLSKIIGFIRIYPPLIVNNKIRSDLTSTLTTFHPQQIPMLNYKFGQVFRLERHTDLGRTNQFEQFDFDIINLHVISSEMILHLVLSSLLNYINLDLCNLTFGNINILNGICDLLGLNCYPTKKLTFISILDKAIDLNFENFKQILITGKYDVSGDYIYGIGLTSKVINNTLYKFWICSYRSNSDINAIYTNIRHSFIGSFGTHELFTTILMLTMTGMKVPSQVINPLLARGLSYYTSNIFELQPICPCCNSSNVFVRIGSLLAGGRYDNFIYNLQNPIPSVGYSIGISRILEYYSNINQCFGSSLLNTISICWPQSECFNPSLLINITKLRQLGFKINLLGSINLQEVIKLTTNNDIILYRWQKGWLVKNKSIYQSLSNRIISFKLWKHALSDQFWTKELYIDFNSIKNTTTKQI